MMSLSRENKYFFVEKLENLLKTIKCLLNNALVFYIISFAEKNNKI